MEELTMKQFKLFILFLFPLFAHLTAQEVAITVYNQNRALVREMRSFTLESGTSTISFTNVAARIDPTSVHFKSITAPDKLNILEQNFEYDLVSSYKIMEKYVDQEIRLVTKEGEIFSGQLLSASQSDIILKNKDGGIQIVRGDQVQHFDFPNLPEGLVTRPTLVWMVDNQGPKQQKTEVSYLTDGVDWHAEYVAVTDAQDKNIDLSGWVSVNNQSGTTYENAKLKLVAGDVHRAEPEKRVMRDVVSQVKTAAAPQFEEKAFFEYHLYTLQRKTTLKNNQTKQVSLFPPARAKAQKVFLYDGSRYGKKVRVNLEFQNKKSDGLGLPLPEGKIRVYKGDVDGALEFIGEDRIEHTPVDEKVRVYLGNAFDIVGERTEKSQNKISKRSWEQEIEISLRNHKKEAVDIVVVEHLWGDWTIQESSHPYVKKDANTAEFKVKVPADGEVTVTYRVLFKW